MMKSGAMSLRALHTLGVLFICLYIQSLILLRVSIPAVAQVMAAGIRNVDSDILPSTHKDLPWRQASKRNPNPVPSVEIDCALRHYALEFATEKVPWMSPSQKQDISDALRLQNCSTTKKKPRYDLNDPKDNKLFPNISSATQVLRKRRIMKDTSANNATKSSRDTFGNGDESIIKLFVDPNNGSNDNLGSQDTPLQTISAAVELSRKLRFNKNSKVSIVLRGGRYFLKETLRLDSRDSHLTLEAYPNETPVVSGGDFLSLRLSPTTANPSIYSTVLPEGNYNFTMLFWDRSKFQQPDIRLVWAREPNGHPERDLQPDGYAAANGTDAPYWPDSSGAIHFVVGKNEPRNSSIYPWNGEDLDPRGGGNWLHYGGTGNRFVDGKGYWNGSVPMGLKFQTMQLNTSGWTREGMAPAIAHVFHNGFWGNWQFEIDAVSTSDNDSKNKKEKDGHSEQSIGNICFKRGGWQEGRGGGINHQPFFVEGVKEALDVPGEWWLDVPKQILYYHPFGNETKAYVKNVRHEETLEIDFVAPRLQRLIELVGENSQDRTANGVTMRGLTFAHTATTFMEPYEVPSPGDWSIHRGGAVFLENVVDTQIQDCLFLRTGGNAVMISGHAKQTSIQNNEFAWIGDSAIVTLGKIPIADGFTVDTYPEDTLIQGNHFHDIGIHGKQTSALFSALSCKTTFVENVLYNGPRAGVNLNDQFCHGHTIRENLLFNWVRETQDHGPINTWDRALYIQKEDFSKNPTVVPKWTHIEHNFIMNGPSGNRDLGNLFPTIDNDDGSSYFYIANNLLVYGGGKNYLGHDKYWISNLFVFPGRWSGEPCAQIWGGENHLFADNTCLVAPGNPPIGLDGSMRGFDCKIDWDDPETNLKFVGKTANNSYYMDKNQEWGFGCGNGTAPYHWFSMAEAQQHGWELGSSVHDSKLLSADQLIEVAKILLTIH